jgi:hypothetical protein
VSTKIGATFTTLSESRVVEYRLSSEMVCLVLPVPILLQRGPRLSGAVDLAIVIVVFGVGFLSVPFVNPILRQGHGLSMAFAAAFYQFLLEGLAPLTLMALRREPFSDYGLIRRNIGQSLALGLGFAIVYDLALSWHAGALLWIPLRRQPAVRMSLAAGLPLGLAGLAVSTLAWGFLEGFFGVYFAKKVNLVFGHSGRSWLAPGGLAFALFNGSVHLIVGQGLQGFLTSFASGYAIAVVPAITGNSWGSNLVQTLTNAVGRL